MTAEELGMMLARREWTTKRFLRSWGHLHSTPESTARIVPDRYNYHAPDALIHLCACQAWFRLRTICGHCHGMRGDHVNDKCLFAPTMFSPVLA